MDRAEFERCLAALRTRCEQVREIRNLAYAAGERVLAQAATSRLISLAEAIEALYKGDR